MRSRSRRNVLLLVLLPVLAAAAIVAYIAWRQSVPGVQVTAAPPRALGHRAAFPVQLQAARGRVARAEARVVQGQKTAVVARLDAPAGPRVDWTLTVEPAALGLREGDAAIEVWARDDFWRLVRLDDRVVARYPVTIDLTPPRIEVLGATPYISPGGAGVVAFRVTDASRAEVRVGGQSFPSFPMGPTERGARVAFVALAHDFAPGTPLAVTAGDEAGNQASRAIPAEFRPRAFPRDTITVREAFLEAKVPELLPQRAPADPLVAGFLVINREQRRQAEEQKRQIGTKTAATVLWEGPFVQPPNTKVFANFAETRTYLYNGNVIDTQVHFGYDLAATKQMAVPAANKGVVVFAGPLTIYGNTLVLDHGLGLQTLYAHLSSMAVKPGDAVTKGQEIGRSGTSGLALGDHLHYEVLVHGISVTPLEWWDAKWIRDRVAGPIRDAGLGDIAGFTAAPAGDDAPARTPRPPRRR